MFLACRNNDTPFSDSDLGRFAPPPRMPTIVPHRQITIHHPVHCTICACVAAAQGAISMRPVPGPLQPLQLQRWLLPWVPICPGPRQAQRRYPPCCRNVIQSAKPTETHTQRQRTTRTLHTLNFYAEYVQLHPAKTCEAPACPCPYKHRSAADRCLFFCMREVLAIW